MNEEQSKMVGFDHWQVAERASVVATEDGALVVTTPLDPWSYAILAPLSGMPAGADAVGYRLVLDVEVASGVAGVFLTDSVAQVPSSPETLLSAELGRVAVTLDSNNPNVRQLCIRSGQTGSARIRVWGVTGVVRRRFDITESIHDLLPVMLRSPATAIGSVAEALSRQLLRPVSPDEIGGLVCSRVPLAVPFERVLEGEVGQRVRDDLAQLLELLPTYDPSGMDAGAGYLGRDYFERFFHQSTIRVYQLVTMLREFGATGGTVLEVGSLFGQFALSLSRLGFDVTVVDRYRDYGMAYEGYTKHLRSAGVHVVETGVAEEADLMRSLGQFDTVICMAVVEHIPHTPRELLRTLASHVRRDGILALDSPNIARYWNRKRLAEGQSIHQPIADQFYSEIPWGGHHREFTGAEMIWMLEQVGAREVKSCLFDYNILQFSELWSSHVESLLAMVVDPSMADTTLVAGRLNP